jgi:tetratricopeptide (TPR) repeat protein
MAAQHTRASGAGSEAAEIGGRLRELRLSRGLLQQDLATSEITASYVSLIEAGKRRPSAAVLAALAERVGSTAEYLRTGRDERELNRLRLELGFAEMALRKGDHGEALQGFNQVLTSSSAPLDAGLRLQARIGQAKALEKLGRLDAAISILNDLAEETDLPTASTQWAEVMVALCRCYRVAGDINMSVEIGERAMRRLDELGLEMTEDHIKVGVDLVDSYYRREDLTRAHLLSTRLLAQSERAESHESRGFVYWNAGLVAESRGQRDEAIVLVERALGFMAESDNSRYPAMLRVLRGWLLLKSDAGDAAAAKALFEEARAMLAAAGGGRESGDCEVGLAVACLRLGRLDEARDHAGRALDVLGEEPSDLAAQARVVLGEALLLGGGDPALAQDSLHAAARQLGLLPRSWKTATVYRYLGDVWNRHGNVHEAVKAYQLGLTAGGAGAMPSPSKG